MGTAITKSQPSESLWRLESKRLHYTMQRLSAGRLPSGELTGGILHPIWQRKRKAVKRRKLWFMYFLRLWLWFCGLKFSEELQGGKRDGQTKCRWNSWYYTITPPAFCPHLFLLRSVTSAIQSHRRIFRSFITGWVEHLKKCFLSERAGFGGGASSRSAGDPAALKSRTSNLT